MGYFTKPDGSPRSELAPLSTGRVTSCLDSHNWHYDVSDDGEVGGWWDGYWFMFSTRGRGKEIFFVHAIWGRKAPAERFTEILTCLNEWNSEHLWPMLSAREREGEVAVLADLSVDYSFGLTDAQLDLHIRCSIDTMVAAMQWLDGKFPEYLEEG